MFEVIEDTFARRATLTLNKRGASLLAFLVLHRKEYGFAGLPIRESAEYKFIKHELSQKAATAASSFLSSVRFPEHVLELTDTSLVTNSAELWELLTKSLCRRDL